MHSKYLIIFLPLILLLVLVISGYHPYAHHDGKVTITSQEYEDLKKKADTLPSEIQHSEHMANDATACVKENIELKSRIDTCEANKDTLKLKEIITMQNEQLNKLHEEIENIKKEKEEKKVQMGDKE